MAKADGTILIDSEIDQKGLKKDIEQLKGNVGGAFNKIGKAAIAGAAVATTAIAGFAASSIKEFATFESGMNEVFTLLPGMTDDAMKDMEKSVLDFSKEMKVLPEKTIPALYQAISAGVPKENVFDFLTTAQKAAKGGVTELETAVDGISSVVNAYGADVIDATKVSDLMFTAVKNGKTTFDEMAASLFQVIPTASSLGVEFDNVTAAIATMTAQGTPTSVATTQMRQLFVELSKSGSKAAKTFEEISGKTFKQFISEGGNVQDALKQMEREAQRNNISISDLFSSVEAGNAALSLTGKNAKKFAQNLKDMQDAAGATDAAYDQMNQGINTALESLAASFSSLKITVGREIAPVIEGLANKMAELASDEKFVEDVTNLVRAAVEFLVGAFQFLITKISAVINFFEKNKIAGGLLITVITALTAATIAYNIALGIMSVQFLAASISGGTFATVLTALTGPVGLVILAITALILVIIQVQQNWEKITDFFKRTWKTISNAFEQGMQNIKDGFKKMWENIFRGFREGVRKTVAFFRTMYNQIANVFANISEIGRNIVEGIWRGITEMANEFRRRVNSFFRGIVDGVKNFLGIHSPSRLFRDEIGKMMAEGVSVGFEGRIDKMDTSMIRKMKGLSSNISMAASQGMRANPSTNHSRSMNQTNNFKGMFEGAKFMVREEADIDKLANKISRKINLEKIRTSRGFGYAR